MEFDKYIEWLRVSAENVNNPSLGAPLISKKQVVLIASGVDALKKKVAELKEELEQVTIILSHASPRSSVVG